MFIDICNESNIKFVNYLLMPYSIGKDGYPLSIQNRFLKKEYYGDYNYFEFINNLKYKLNCN